MMLFKLPSSFATLLLAVSSPVCAQEAPTEKPDNTPETLISATQTCVDIFLQQPDPLDFVPSESWEYAERTPNAYGALPPYHRVVHRIERVALHYVPDGQCVVFAELLDQEFDDEPSNGRTREELVNGLRTAIESEHGFLGFRSGNPDDFVVVTLATEQFEIDVEMAPPPPGGSYYIIVVRPLAAHSGS